MAFVQKMATKPTKSRFSDFVTRFSGIYTENGEKIRPIWSLYLGLGFRRDGDDVVDEEAEFRFVGGEPRFRMTAELFDGGSQTGFSLTIA